MDSVSVVFPGLVSLRIKYAIGLSELEVVDASGSGLWPEGQTLPKLVSLDVLNMSIFPRNMAGNCAAVELLTCSDMSAKPFNELSIPDAGLSLQLLGRRLCSLTVSNVMTDELLANVILACPLLTILFIGYTSVDVSPQVTDVGVVATANARGLRRVTLLLCNGVTCAGVASLAVRPVMELINLVGCPRLQWQDVQRTMKLVGRLGVDFKVI